VGMLVLAVGLFDLDVPSLLEAAHGEGDEE